MRFNDSDMQGFEKLEESMIQQAIDVIVKVKKFRETTKSSDGHVKKFKALLKYEDTEIY
jgi:hypothetical protein